VGQRIQCIMIPNQSNVKKNRVSKSEGDTQPALLRPVMPELDTIRGLAIIGVLFYHGLFWRIDLSRFPSIVRTILSALWLGRLGVDLFFVLSGFLITGLLVDSKNRPDYYSRFYIRRALRIFPAYLLTLCVLAAIGYAPWRFIVLSLLYCSNLTPLLGIPIAYSVLWSLAVEEHFYLIWPAVTRRATLIQISICCFALILLSPISRLVSFYLTEKNGYAPFVCNEYTWNSLDGLACGALLAVYLRMFNHSRRQLVRLMWSIAGLGLCLWVVGIPWGIWTRQRPLGAALQVVPWHFIFVALIGGALILGTGPQKKLVHARSLRLFGEISYGLYLYHVLIFDGLDFFAKRRSLSWIGTGSTGALLLRFMVASIVAIAISVASRRLFENRFLALKSILTRN
jgi:peptidoglycan/LPS O-acetylase OafA/YrhL